MRSLRPMPALSVPAGVLALMLACAGGANPAEAPRLVQAGPVTGDAEKDTVAYEVADRTECGGLVPRFSDRPTRLGPVADDPEKENFGLMAIGHEDCNTAASRR